MKLLSGVIPFRRSKEQPPAPGPEPVPPPAPEPAPPAPEPQPPTPDPTPPPELRAVPASEPEPEVDLESEPPLARIPLNGAPREWNVWELERIASYSEPRDDEVAFLLLELRQFANAHGQLPVSFDPIIRESFGELLYVAV
jgi:hypothetical protein